MDDPKMDGDAIARLMAGLPVADLRLLVPLVASPDWRVQLHAVRALMRQPDEGPAPHKFAALIEGLATRPLPMPMELLVAIASHDDDRAVSTLQALANEFPGKRAIWEVLVRIAPLQACARLETLTDLQLLALRDSLEAGPLAEALVISPSPALVRRLINLLPRAAFVEVLLRRMGHSPACHTEVLRAY